MWLSAASSEVSVNIHRMLNSQMPHMPQNLLTESQIPSQEIQVSSDILSWCCYWLVWSTKPAWCSLSCLQALDHRVQTLTSDLSAQNDSVTKFQKRRALEEVHQAEITVPFFFTLSHSHSPSLGKGKNPIVCLFKYCETTVHRTNTKGAVCF